MKSVAAVSVCALCLAGAAIAQEPEQALVVRGLEFSGNRAIADDALRASIATSQSGWWARFSLVRWIGLGEKRVLNETEFRRDVLRILLLYRRSGFMEARVDTVVRRSEADGDVRIRFQIAEGQPVRVTSLQVTGIDAIVPERRLLSELPLQISDPFDRRLFLASADTIRVALRNRGYPFVEVFRNFDVNTEEHRAAVEYDVVPGPLAVVEQVEVVGPNEIDEDVIRRALSVRRGQRYNEDALYESQRQLYRLGVFDYVNVALADSTYDEPEDSLVTVRVQVAEGRLRRIRAGAGYGSLDCMRTLAAWTVRDFLGGGRTFELTGQLSKIGVGGGLDMGFADNLCRQLRDDEATERDTPNYNLTASLRFPYVLSSRTSATIALSAERRSEFQAFLRAAVGANVSITRRTRWNVPITLSYSWSRGRTEAEDAVFCSVFNVCRIEDIEVFRGQNRIQSTVGVGLVRDRLNSVFNPTRGSSFTIQLRHASSAIGSDSSIQFTKALSELAAYHPLGRRTVFAWRVRFGSTFSPREQGVQSIPTEERFYAGGPTTVRGFRQNELGPVVRVALEDTVTTGDSPEVRSDTLVSPTGGNQMLIANAELRFPLPGFSDRLNGAFFVDAGRVFERGGDPLGQAGFRVTPGFGLRFLTPLGPIRLDAAYNGYDPQAGELYERIDFGTTSELRLVSTDFAPEGERGFFGRLRYNFSVGQAF